MNLFAKQAHRLIVNHSEFVVSKQVIAELFWFSVSLEAVLVLIAPGRKHPHVRRGSRCPKRISCHLYCTATL